MLTKATISRMNQHVSNIGNREIAIWGASDFGENVLKYLLDQGLSVSCFLDRDQNKQSNKYCERPVLDPTVTISNSKKYYVIVALMFLYVDVTDQLAIYGYKKDEDYLYFADVNLTISEIENYNDSLGNQIIGQPKNINSKVIFKGSNNKLVIENDVELENVQIHFLSDDGYCYIGEKSKYKGSIFIGIGCKVIIGSSIWVTNNCNITTAEYTEVNIGNDCMFAPSVKIWTSDVHPIYDVRSGKRINDSQSISIGNHVWLAQEVTILSGSIIGEGSVIGYGSVVKSSIPNNCIAVGVPARIKKRDIAWDKRYLNSNQPYLYPDNEEIRSEKYWNDTKE